MAGSSLTDALRETLGVFAGPDAGTPLTTNEVAERLELGRRSTYSRLERLVERDLVETKKVGARGRVWWRPPADAPAYVPDEWGELDGFAVVTRDLTDRRGREPALPRERDLLETVLETSPTATGVFDADGEALRINERFAELLGLDGRDPCEYALGDEPVFDGNGEVIPSPERPGRVALATGEPVTDERIKVTDADGGTRWLSVNATPFYGRADGVVVTMVDVTQLEEQARRLERQRDEVEAELQHVFDRVDDAFWGLDDEFRFTYINDHAAELLGRSEAELVGANVWEEFPWLEDVLAREKFEEAMATGQPIHYEDHLEATDRWYDVRLYPSDTGLSVYYQDVTERKEREQALAASERHNRALVENFPNGAVALFDEDLRHVVVGGRLFEELDVTVEELDGRTPREAHPPEVADTIEPHFRAVFDGDSREFDVELGGSVRTFRTLPVRDEDGEVTAGLAMSQDVTDRFDRERELERYETIVETVDDGIYALDEDGSFVLVNDAYCELVGYDREELIGRDATLVHGEAVDARAGRLASEVAAGERELATVEHELDVDGDRSIPVEARLAPYPLDDGFGRCGVVRDVTERIERERELERYVGIVDAVGEAVYELDARGRFTFVNDAMVERSGYAESELLGEHVSIGMDEAAVHRAESHIARLLADDEAVRTTLEYDVIRKDGERVPVENRISVRTDDDGRFAGSAGLLWDVSDRQERERELEESERRYRTLVENFPNGIVTLFDRDLRYLVAGGELYDAFDRSPEDTIGHTLYDRSPPEEVEVLEPAYEAALDGESRSFEIEYAGRTIEIWTGPVTDEAGDVFAGMAMSQDITDWVDRESELERQRERLVALNDLNGVVREITDAVIEQSTRDEIERIVCERLAGTDSYSFAWIGDVDGQSGTVDLRAEAGVEGYLDDVTITVDPDDERSRGPTGRALREREIQVTRDVENDSSHDPWREEVEEYGFQSSAAIPIGHDGVFFGALNVYSERPNAFSEDEQEVIGQLGEVVGHAIAAVERKQALMSDEVVEVEFQVLAPFDDLDLADPATPSAIDGSISLDRSVPIDRGSYLVYGTATGDAMGAVHALVDSDAYPYWTSANVLWRGDGSTRFELGMDQPPVLSAVTNHGGYVDEAVIEGGDLYARVHLAPSADVRQIVDAVERAYPGVVLVTRQQVTRTRPARIGFEGTPLEALTDRQRTAIETAFYAGYFAWPRDSNGGDVAASLGIDPSTFHHHLRGAERKILGSVLGEPA